MCTHTHTLYVHICTYIYIYIYIFTHTHTHTHTGLVRREGTRTDTHTDNGDDEARKAICRDSVAGRGEGGGGGGRWEASGGMSYEEEDTCVPWGSMVLSVHSCVHKVLEEAGGWRGGVSAVQGAWEWGGMRGVGGRGTHVSMRERTRLMFVHGVGLLECFLLYSFLSNLR